MKSRLFLHPDFIPSISGEIMVELEWGSPGQLWLRYNADILPAELEIPGSKDQKRADGLWQTTCFELFLREPGETRYYEFNFSPSRQWAAYAFEDLREGMSKLDIPKTPHINCDLSATHFALKVTLTLPAVLADAPLEAALSAVIADRTGGKSYWALVHPPGKPDFHHPDCFALELAPPSAP